MVGGKVLMACLMLAAQTYEVPPAVLIGIYQIEGGRIGQEVGPNDNGSYDLGPMQINTIWLPDLARRWGVSEATARRWVRDDPCTNTGVAAWILKRHINETGNLSKAIAHYHSRTPRYGTVYKKKVVKAMYDKGLIRDKR
ncbi:MAG: transglycosylase [Alphaproteobacteria bacterium]|nr:transglycosylase [Alphaproteobacteria bacterium]